MKSLQSLTFSVIGVVRGWHSWLTLLQSLMYLLLSNHCACSETIKASPWEWRCRPCVIGILRGRQLRSPRGASFQWGGWACCCQKWQAVCVRTALSPEGPQSFKTRTDRPAAWPFQNPSHVLIITPISLFHFLLTHPLSDSRLDTVWFFAKPKCVLTTGPLQLPTPLLGAECLFFLLPHPLSSDVTSWGQGLLWLSQVK